jgi:hypothetical protein
MGTVLEQRKRLSDAARTSIGSPRADSSELSLIEKLSDRLLTLHEAASLIPGRGRNRVHASTVARWINRGVRTPDGRRIRLRAVRLGSKWLTKRSWIDEFAAAQTPTFIDAVEPGPTDRQRDRAADAAGRRLASMGA